MEVYMVFASIGMSDGDDWQHWIEEEPLSYHISKEGADIRVSKLIEQELIDNNKAIELNLHINDEYWNSERICIQSNIVHLMDQDDKMKECVRYGVKPITVED